ncbi:MAG: flagellar hook basal-body protein [Desulfuromonadaceae bacterium]|nr:flagellar hook basal-body protein [Desulfuromonadaceae bacterium]
MSSGQYSALSGAMSRMSLMDSISDNLSNNKTVGFKRSQVVFEATLADAQNLHSNAALSLTRAKEGLTDYGQGPLIKSGVPTHVAIDGPGFFKVQEDADTFCYTRQGNFRMDENGHMVNGANMKVLGEDGKPIILDNPDVLIDENGNIQMESGDVKKLPIYVFDDRSVMQRKGGGLFSVSKEDIRAFEQRVAEPTIYQGQLEDSNVNMMQEMGKMIESMRAFEACQKMLKNYNSLAEKAVQLGKVG